MWACKNYDGDVQVRLHPFTLLHLQRTQCTLQLRGMRRANVAGTV